MQYDVYPSPDGEGLVVDVQSNLLRRFTTCVVAPLIAIGQLSARNRYLNPSIMIDGAEFVLLPNFTQTVPRAVLGKPLASIAHEDAMISRAYDYLLHGN